MAISATLGAGCGRTLEPAECLHLLDHYTELLVVEENPGATPERVATDKARARSTALKDPRFDFQSCSRKVSRADFECALGAPTVDAVERCLTF